MNHRHIISDWFYKYSHDVYNFLIYYQGTTDVQDLVQEVFIKAAKGLHSFRYDANPKTWLFSIARHVAIDNARKRQRRIDPTTVSLEEHHTEYRPSGPEDILLEDEAMQELYMMILELKASYRDVLILRGIEAMSTAETADILGWKKTKVKQTYHRAKKALQKRLVHKGDINHEA